MRELIKAFHDRGGYVLICGVPTGTMESMRRAGFLDLLGQEKFYWSVERALLDHPPIRE